MGDEIVLALAIVARAPGLGHVCVDLSRLAEQVEGDRPSTGTSGELPWPRLTTWIRAIKKSPLVHNPSALPWTVSGPWSGMATGSISSATGMTSGRSPPT